MMRNNDTTPEGIANDTLRPPYHLCADGHRPAFGLGSATPALRWKLASPIAGDELELIATRDGGYTERASITLPHGIDLPWPFRPLSSRTRAQVVARVRSGSTWSASSSPLQIETTLLQASDWRARAISPRTLGGLDAAAPILQTSHRAREKPTQARLYVSALGLYEFRINGTRISDDLLTPGWTSYRHRLKFQTYDITPLIQQGLNQFSALLGNGWYRGHLTWNRVRDHYGDRLALLAQIELTYPDGSSETIGTDETWQAAASRLLSNDLYDGSSIDLRRGTRADDAVESVDVLDGALPHLVPMEPPPVRATEQINAVTLSTTGAGTSIVDFGQNLVGWVRLGFDPDRHRTTGTVSVRHAEVLEDGALALRPLRSAQALDTYLLDADAPHSLEPIFTFHGFRYAEIDGISGLDAADVSAVVVGTALRRIGWLQTSNPAVNKLHENTVWSARGNFLEVPTDCPQRDERLGWTGDIQVFSPTAAFLFDTRAFLSSWLKDLALDQHPDGSVPDVIPDVLPHNTATSAAWGDAAVVIPDVLFQHYGDRRVLARQYASAERWVHRIHSITGDGLIWDEGPQYGDWLDPSAPPDNPHQAMTAPGLIATACFARCTDLLARAAAELERTAASIHYRQLFERIRTAFINAHGRPGARLSSDTQTAYSVALQWGLIEESDRASAARRLVELVRANRHCVGTGFVGTPLILDALTDAGYEEDAFAMLLQTECPSWLYPVSMGATTIWERWDSMLPDGQINSGEMTSFNHYAYGAVADWLHRRIGGLAPAAPGYARVLISPLVWGPIDHASARHESPYGPIEVSWNRRSEDEVSLTVSLPPGVQGEVRVGTTHRNGLGAGTHSMTIGRELPVTVRTRR